MDLQELQSEASICDKCLIHKNRLKPVFARGDPNSKVIILGMCPGNVENEVGFPFVGPAGKLLDVLIRESLNCYPYITNLVKCFVKPGIKLTNEWMDNCLPYFILQLKLIQPKIIVALGGDVGNYLSDSVLSVGVMRKMDFTYMNIPLSVTYHPSYFKRGGGEKHRDFYKGLEDFNKINNYLSV